MASKQVAVFASGEGSNALRLFEHFKQHEHASVAVLFCNKPGAGVIAKAGLYNVPVVMIDKEIFFRGSGYVDVLKEKNIDLVVLAGFLWKIPQTLIDAYRNRIINLHPALLPKYGGKGMYGLNVHAAVIEAGETESGITIHYVDEHYDNGDIILQQKCPVLPSDTPEALAARIHVLEHEYLPKVTEHLVRQLE